ncbi:hypothetical protein FPV67DRAFT_1355510, partial [Lyophyllum atratum]
YDWLADSATTAHISNQRRGTVELESYIDGTTYILKLQNVLHIPDNRNNLMSLGRWDASGGRYQGGNGTLSLINNAGHIVAKGTKVNNHLY